MDKCCLNKCRHDSWNLFKDGPRHLPLKFGQNWTGDIELVWVVCKVIFVQNPNLGEVELGF